MHVSNKDHCLADILCHCFAIQVDGGDGDMQYLRRAQSSATELFNEVLTEYKVGLLPDIGPVQGFDECSEEETASPRVVNKLSYGLCFIDSLKV